MNSYQAALMILMSACVFALVYRSGCNMAESIAAMIGLWNLAMLGIILNKLNLFLVIIGKAGLHE